MFKEKLFKKLYSNLEELKFQEPTVFQQKALSIINSGADLIGIAPAGAGKTTMISIMAVQKLQRPIDDAPKVMILVADKEKGLALHDQVELFARETGLRIVSVFEDGHLDEQNAEIYEGTDILIGTAKRLMDIYFSRSLNLNKIKMLVIDEPQAIIKNGWQGQTDRLALSLPKCQRIVLTQEMNDKIEKLITKFMPAPKIIELE